MKAVIGIDPGMKGALVVLCLERRIRSFLSMPMAPKNKAYDKEEISQSALFHWLNGVENEFEIVGAFCERPVTYGMPSTHAFTYGYNFALLAKVLEAHFPVQYIDPSEWTKELHHGFSKDLKPKPKSLAAFNQLFPEFEFKKNKALTEGLIDATLIAEWGRRVIIGAEPLQSQAAQSRTHCSPGTDTWP